MNEAVCQGCNGTGYHFTQVDADHRKQQRCPMCGGSGKAVDAVEHILTGEGFAPPPPDKFEKDALAARYQWFQF